MEEEERADWVEEEIQRQLLSLQHLSLQDLELEEEREGQELGCYDDNQVCNVHNLLLHSHWFACMHAVYCGSVLPEQLLYLPHAFSVYPDPGICKEGGRNYGISHYINIACLAGG